MSFGDLEKIARSGVFRTSEEFVTTMSSTKRDLKKYAKEKKFIDKVLLSLPDGLKTESEQGKHGLFPGEIEERAIVNAMVHAGLVKNPESLVGKLQVWLNLNKVHQTNYWEGYSFINLEGTRYDYTLYKMRRDDVSGIGPG